MRRFILLMISSFAILVVSAQEEIVFDSIPKKPAEIRELQPAMESPLRLNETAFPAEISLFDHSLFSQPLLPDYTKNLDFKKYLYPLKESGYSYFEGSYFTGSSFNPGFPSGHVFNQSTYQLNNHLLIGGNSFGARSVFDAPKINSTIQDMNIKGASFFMQYKVNDHFRVETRVSISNRPSSPWEP
jgi:hypothetical protein